MNRENGQSRPGTRKVTDPDEVKAGIAALPAVNSKTHAIQKGEEMRTTAPQLRLVTKPPHVPLRCRPGTGIIIAAVIGAGVWLIVLVSIWL